MFGGQPAQWKDAPWIRNGLIVYPRDTNLFVGVGILPAGMPAQTKLHVDTEDRPNIGIRVRGVGGQIGDLFRAESFVPATLVAILNNGQLVVGAGALAGTELCRITGGAFLVDGAAGVVPVAGAGTRMFFSGAKAAFRAGVAAGAEWDDANVGTGSIGLGNAVTASQVDTIAIGYETIANASSSAAIGWSSSASAQYAMALGAMTQATARAAHSWGESCVASGVSSTAGGLSCTASGDRSCAIGSSNQSSNVGAVCLGVSNVGSGAYSYCCGYSNWAAAIYSAAEGYCAYATLRGQQVRSGVDVTGAGTLGHSQESSLVVSRRSVDDAAVVLTLDGAAPVSGNSIVLRDNTSYTFTIRAVTRCVAGTDVGASAHWIYHGGIERGAGVGTVVLNGTNRPDGGLGVLPAWASGGIGAAVSLAVAADAVLGALQITFTGRIGEQNANTWDTDAAVEWVEVQ